MGREAPVEELWKRCKTRATAPAGGRSTRIAILGSIVVGTVCTCWMLEVVVGGGRWW